MEDRTARYHTASIAMHWAMLALLVAVYACIELREYFPKGSATRDGLKMWHFMLGLAVFLLVWLRLLLRIIYPSPPITPALGRLSLLMARAVHLALYGLMILMPLGGWLILSASGKPIPFFGLELPALVAPDKQLAETVAELHETFGVTGYFLIGAHAAASLYHHYFRRDDTLKRMRF